MASLPIEIIANILSRLPVKLLLRFICVCKPWYSLIKSPKFVKLHLNQTLTSNSDGHLLLCYRSIHSSEFDIRQTNNHLSFSELNHPLNSDKVLLLGSCNGVVCISDYYRDNVFLYNPLTNSHRKLPINHITDPHTETVTFGFGYDSKADDYKVFRLFQKLQNEEVCYNKAEVYSLRNNSWKSVKDIPYSANFVNHYGVLLNEVMHYIVYTKELGSQYKFIGTFNFSTETFSHIDCPNYDNKFGNNVFMQVNALGGCLSMLLNFYTINSAPPTQRYGYRRLDHVDLWIMKEYGKKESWVRLFTISHPQSIGINEMIWSVVNSEDGRKILLEVDSSQLGWYDMETGSFERITSDGQLDPPVCTGFLVGSLVSLVGDKLESKDGTMPILPIEIIANILSRLPVNLLLRYTIMCKSWYTLIKSPSFIKLHLNQTLISNPNRHLICTYKSIHFADLDIHPNYLSFTELDHPLKPQKIRLIGSCNGVICISDYSKNDVFLYNPLTKSYHKLPPNPIPNSNDVSLVFGFCYDSKNDDYKVLRLLQDSENNESFYNEAKVYSLKNKSWKCVEPIPYRLYHVRVHLVNRHGVLVNEAIHYIVTTELGSKKKLIASFDFRTETYSLMDCPNYYDDFRSILDLSELGGCLCLLVNYCTVSYVYNCISHSDRIERRLDCADLWVMKEYGKKESWVRLFNICEPENILIPAPIRTVVYSKDGRKILLEVDGMGLGWYDLETKCFEICNAHLSPEPPFETGLFVGSLVSLSDEKLQSEGGTMSRKKKKRNDLDNFLSSGFKLRL